MSRQQRAVSRPRRQSPLHALHAGQLHRPQGWSHRQLRVRHLLGLERSTYLQQQIFNVFDKDGDGRINFTEFLQALSVLSHKAPKEDKLSFSFPMYDRDGDRKIGKVELSEMLKTAIQSLPHKFTDEQVAQLIETTFKEADLNNDGYINFDEYCKMSIQHPQMLSQMTINVSESIKGFGGKKKKLKGKKKKSMWGGKAAPPPAP